MNAFHSPSLIQMTLWQERVMAICNPAALQSIKNTDIA